MLVCTNVAVARKFFAPPVAWRLVLSVGSRIVIPVAVSVGPVASGLARHTAAFAPPAVMRSAIVVRSHVTTVGCGNVAAIYGLTRSKCRLVSPPISALIVRFIVRVVNNIAPKLGPVAPVVNGFVKAVW